MPHSGYRPPPPGRYQRAMFQQHYVPPPPAPPPPAPVPVDMAAKLRQLQQLGNLKANGALTDEEFQTQKQRILES